MKILIISEYFPPDQVGASRRTKILAKVLSNNNKIKILTTSPHYPGEISKVKWYKPYSVNYNKNIEIHRFWMPIIPMNNSIGRILNYTVFSILASFFILFAGKSDIVWGTSPNVFVTIPINFHSIIYKSKRIINIDDLWPNAPIELGYLRNGILRSISKKFALISILSTDGISTISDKLKNIVNQIHKNTIPTASVYVGIEDYRLSKFRKLMNNKKTDITSPFIFMYSGKLGPAYDFRIMINGFKNWIQMDKLDTRLVIRGTGPEELGLRKLVNSIPNAPIKISSNYLEDDKYDHLLSSVNCFILPMKDNFISTTAIPTKLLEYISTGKVILGISKGEPKRIISESKSGLICDYNLENIVDTYSKIYHNSNEFHNSEFQMQYIKENFSEKIIRKQAQQLFSDMD